MESDAPAEPGIASRGGPGIASGGGPGIASGGGPGFIRINGITKRFAGQTAVDGIDLTIGSGELFSLLGGSGCGKTTLLRMLAGFVTPDEGTIEIDGRDMAGLSPHLRPVNMMFQSYALFPHMDVAANVAFGLRRDGVGKREAHTRAMDALDMVQMQRFSTRRPDALSGGQRQRVALARALIKKPRVLLLDEPLSALDRKLREETALELVRIQRDVGTTFVMVTHDQEEAMTMSTRIAVMDRGRIVQVGTPDEIYERPRDRFVASFIGAINMFEGRCRRDGGDLISIEAIGAGGTIAALLDETAPRPIDGSTVHVAVRPEQIDLHPAGTDARTLDRACNAIEGEVATISYLGASRLYQIRLAGGMVARVSVPADDPGRRFRVEDEVTLVWDAEVSRVFA